MSKFETGITGYIHASAKIEVYFPIDSRGNAHICCNECFYHNPSTHRCRANGEVASFEPNKYVGTNCPLEMDTDENE